MAGWVVAYPAFAQTSVNTVGLADVVTPIHTPLDAQSQETITRQRIIGRNSRAWQSFYASKSPPGLPETRSERLGFGENAPWWNDSGHFSIAMSPKWIWRINRGVPGDLDQLTNPHIHRSTVSATYIQRLGDGEWQTTLGWGRRAKRSSEPVMGYLIESTVRFHESESVFGMLEQVGSDDPARSNAPSQHQLFKMNKLMLGYYHHSGGIAPTGVDIGGSISRHIIPPGMARSYGSVPTLYTLFIRFKFD